MTIGGKNIMLDCGMHMGFNDDVRKHLLEICNLRAKNP